MQYFLKNNDKVPSLPDSIRVLKSLKGKIVSEINIKMWPPIAEPHRKFTVVSCGIKFSDNICISIDTTGNQYSILAEEIYTLEEANYPLSLIFDRMDYWMNDDTEGVVFDYEVFYTDEHSPLWKLIGKKITQVKLLNKGKEDFNPYGLMIIFDNDIKLTSFSNTYGNSIQVNDFMRYFDPLLMNDFLGETILIDIDDVVLESKN